MPTRNDKRVNNGPIPDFSDVFPGELQDDRNDPRLKRAAETVARKYEEAMHENEELRAAENGPGALLLVVVFIIAGRLGLYAFVEDWGNAAANEGVVANIVSILGSLIVLCAWAREEWRRSRWLMIPAGIVVSVALVVCGASLIGGENIAGMPVSHRAHTSFVALFACAGFGLAASRFFTWMIKRAMNFLNHPIRTLRGQ